MPRPVLLMLSQFTHDPTSGAVRSLRTMIEWLGASGFPACAIGTTATDHADNTLDAMAVLRDLGVPVTIDEPVRTGDARVIRFVARGVECVILDTGKHRAASWLGPMSPQYNRLLADLHARMKFEVCLTMGAMPEERERQAWLRARGCAVVLGVRQHGYYHPGAFVSVDDALMPSEFLVRRYHERVGVRGTALPMPIDIADVIPEQKQAMFVTQVNPNPDKGLYFLVRLADELCAQRPGFPLLIIESRGGGTGVLAAARASGIDLARHTSIMVSPGVPKPSMFLAATKILLAPSVWEEPSGRVAAEAMLCGVPPVVSDRGGLPETVGKHGFVLPLPTTLTPESRAAVSRDDVLPWTRVILQLMDDAAFYERACQSAARGGAAFRPEALVPRYVQYFEGVRLTNRGLSGA